MECDGAISLGGGWEGLHPLGATLQPHHQKVNIVNCKDRCVGASYLPTYLSINLWKTEYKGPHRHSIDSIVDPRLN